MKIPVPNKKELLEFLVEELHEKNITLSGNLTGFSNNLHKSFKRFIKGKEYKDKLFYEFVFITIDTLLSSDLPSHITDNSVEPRAAIGKKRK